RQARIWQGTTIRSAPLAASGRPTRSLAREQPPQRIHAFEQGSGAALQVDLKRGYAQERHDGDKDLAGLDGVLGRLGRRAIRATVNKARLDAAAGHEQGIALRP